MALFFFSIVCTRVFFFFFFQIFVVACPQLWCSNFVFIVLMKMFWVDVCNLMGYKSVFKGSWFRPHIDTACPLWCCMIFGTFCCIWEAKMIGAKSLNISQGKRHTLWKVSAFFFPFLNGPPLADIVSSLIRVSVTPFSKWPLVPFPHGSNKLSFIAN